MAADPSIASSPACTYAAPRRAPAPPALQANVHDISRKLQRNTLKENGASMAVTASALGSKDSLYTIQDAPAAPTTRIPAAQVRLIPREALQGGGAMSAL
jgi:exoribonuclease II